MDFIECRDLAAALTKKVRTRKISFGTVKEIIPAPINDGDAHNRFMHSYWFLQALEICANNSGGKAYGLFVVFEDNKEGKDLHIRTFGECQTEFNL